MGGSNACAGERGPPDARWLAAQLLRQALYCLRSEGTAADSRWRRPPFRRIGFRSRRAIMRLSCVRRSAGPGRTGIAQGEAHGKAACVRVSAARAGPRALTDTRGSRPWRAACRRASTGTGHRPFSRTRSHAEDQTCAGRAGATVLRGRWPRIHQCMRGAATVAGDEVGALPVGIDAHAVPSWYVFEVRGPVKQIPPDPPTFRTRLRVGPRRRRRLSEPTSGPACLRHPAVAAIRSNPDAIAATSASISASVIGVESVAEQLLIIMMPDAKR